MLVKIDRPKLFAEVISIISELVTEVKIKVDDSGLSIIATDPANVALVSFKMPKENFSEFEAGKEILGVNLDSLKNVLRRCVPGSFLIMQTHENFLRLEIHDKVKREFNLSLIEIDEKEKGEPELEFKSKIEIASDLFSESIEDCAVVADSCSFITRGESFILEAKGLNSARSEFSSDEAKIQAEDSKAKYSLEYLQKFIKAGKISEKVIINFSTDYPLKLEFRGEGMYLGFVLAPRVETED